MSSYVEQIARLGPSKGMVGILARRTPAEPASERPVAIVLNAGIIHRVGANRLHVLLARRLASEGMSTLRFDLSGIGDSERRSDALAPLDAALADIREALDSMAAEVPGRKFLLIGLCSGADQAVFYAGSDPRVVGLVMMDPTVSHTARYWLHYYTGRMFSARSWLNVFSGRHLLWRRVRGLLRLQKPESAGARESLSIDSDAGREFLKSKYLAALQLQRQMLVVLTDDREARHTYREQLPDSLPGVPFGNRLQLEWFRDTTHTFDSIESQTRLLDVISEWTLRHWPAVRAD